jgi:trk system potassium uptake protein TrkA
MKRHDVSLIEQRADRVAEVRVMLPDLEVHEGDACEPAVLDRTGVRGADVLLAATGDDEDNLVVAMLAKVYQISTVFARVNHPSNEWLFTKEWGVDVAVSPTDIMYGLVEKQVGLGDLITLLRLQADNASIQEVTLPPHSDAVGKRLAELKLPANSQVMAIISAEGSIQVARGDTVLNAGDQVLLLTEGECGPEVCYALGVEPAGIGSGIGAVDTAGENETSAEPTPDPEAAAE